jgi:hypothetical protein
VEAGNYTTLVHSVLTNFGKSVLKNTETLWKNSVIIAKMYEIPTPNFIAIAVTFSEKETGGNTFVLPLVGGEQLACTSCGQFLIEFVGSPTANNEFSIMRNWTADVRSQQQRPHKLITKICRLLT